MKNTFQWLNAEERGLLLSLNINADKIINETFSIDTVTEVKLFPYSPVGRNAHDQGKNKPWMPSVEHCEIVKENDSGTVCITHPQDSSFTKYETRKGISARVRREYFGDWEKMVRAVMPKALAALKWSIYQIRSYDKCPHIYLECDLPSPSGSGRVSLYVPVSYFASGNWMEVVDLHMRLAVGYYKGTGFRVGPKKLREWQDMTAAALVSKEAQALRAIVE